MTFSIAGRYIDHSIDLGFVYEYTCPECDKRFRTSAPELSSPTLCHGCMTGHQRGEVKHAGKRLKKMPPRD